MASLTNANVVINRVSVGSTSTAAPMQRGRGSSRLGSNSSTNRLGNAATTTTRSTCITSSLYRSFRCAKYPQGLAPCVVEHQYEEQVSVPSRRYKRGVVCHAEGEGAAGGAGGGGSEADGGFSLPWQKNKGGGGGGSSDTEEAMNKPNILWRVVSACMYFIPWIDAQQLSNYFYDQWSVLLPLYMVPAWPARLYCITPMAPIIWFFMLFSLVIRNKRLPHFLRFHTMQAMMTDIVVMLFGLTRQSLPYYIAGSWVDAVFSQYAFLCALLTVIWCIWKTLEGYYVELPFVSEAVYIQLSIADMM